MPNQVTFVFENFPKSDGIRPIQTIVDEAWYERLKRGYLKWQAYQERKEAARIHEVPEPPRAPKGYTLAFDRPNADQVRMLELLTTVKSFSTRVEERRDGTYVVINHEEQ